MCQTCDGTKIVTVRCICGNDDCHATLRVWCEECKGDR